MTTMFWEPIANFPLVVILVTSVRCATVASGAYLYVQDAVNWDKAATECLDKGYVLAHPANQEENDLLVKFLTTNAPSDAEIWMGGYLDQSESWNWYTGEPIKWTDWASSQPNDINQERCIRIRMVDNKWWNRECSRRYSFVCQLDAVREARFSLLKRDEVPTETPLMKYSVTSAPECTLRCMNHYDCKLYSVQTISENQYLCHLFTSGNGMSDFLSQAKTRLYSRES